MPGEDDENDETRVNRQRARKVLRRWIQGRRKTLNIVSHYVGSYKHAVQYFLDESLVAPDGTPKGPWFKGLAKDREVRYYFYRMRNHSRALNRLETRLGDIQTFCKNLREVRIPPSLGPYNDY
jgi:hypothetical protein